MLGVGGVTTIILLILGGALVAWVPPQAALDHPALSLLHIAPPAAPPEPVRQMPPGPEQLLEEDIPAPKLKRPTITVPEIRIAREDMPSVAVEPPRRDPSVQHVTAPESRPAPPAPQVSADKPTWEALVLGALNKVKRYPRAAASHRQQGIPWIGFVMNRKGEVLSVRLERSSGVPALDNEAVALPTRASPLPEPPETVAGVTLELVVPVEFFMR
jgi:protein TonB